MATPKNFAVKAVQVGKSKSRAVCTGPWCTTREEAIKAFAEKVRGLGSPNIYDVFLAEKCHEDKAPMRDGKNFYKGDLLTLEEAALLKTSPTQWVARY